MVCCPAHQYEEAWVISRQTAVQVHPKERWQHCGGHDADVEHGQPQVDHDDVVATTVHLHDTMQHSIAQDTAHYSTAHSY
jgi:hypothetical protein